MADEGRVVSMEWMQDRLTQVEQDNMRLAASNADLRSRAERYDLQTRCAAALVWALTDRKACMWRKDCRRSATEMPGDDECARCWTEWAVRRAEVPDA